MFETELNHGNDAKATQLQASLYYADDNAKTGQTNRLEIFKDSTWVELMAPIHADLCMQERFLINQCELRIELYRNRDSFCLVDQAKSKHQYKLEIKQMSLFIKKIEVSDSISMAIE